MAVRPGARTRVQWRSVDGILLLDKDAGLSSNAALQRVRKLFRARKAGHTGSLDPLASGLLPVCFGQATKISGTLLDADKTYLVDALLGTRTTTGDAEGEVVESRPVPSLDVAAVDAVLAEFVGPGRQVPPMFSSLKRQGRRLYQLARQGIEVPREPRPIHIHDLHRRSWDGRQLSLEVRCSKGTYVRTLVEDLALALDTVGHVSALRRSQLGPFREQRLWRVEELEALRAAGGEDALDDILLRPDAALHDWPEVVLGVAEQACLLQGQAVFASGPAGARVRLYGPGRRFLGVGQVTAEGRRVVPKRIMLDLQAGQEAPAPLEPMTQRR